MPQAGNATFNNVASGVTFALSGKHGGFNETFNAAGTGLTDLLLITHKAGTAVGTDYGDGFRDGDGNPGNGSCTHHHRGHCRDGLAGRERYL